MPDIDRFFRGTESIVLQPEGDLISNFSAHKTNVNKMIIQIFNMGKAKWFT